MAHLNRLNALQIRNAKKPGLYSDGGGLALQVSKSGTKSWVFRFSLNKRPRMMGLGGLDTFSITDARALASECRRKLASGIDPIEARILEQKRAMALLSKPTTFDDCTISYIAGRSAGWKSQKHVAQWESSLRRYASPIIGTLPVAEIELAHILQILEPIWREKPETASRVRNRIELILSWATVRGFRTSENCARWKGHLDQVLPRRADVRPVRNFRSLPYREVPGFVSALHIRSCISARALEFQILCGSRSGEVFGATWSEINFEQELWTIPKERMKAKKEHRVPLSPRALEILRELQSHRESEFIFPGARPGKPLSSNAFLVLIQKRMGLAVTAHGFRAAFRTWASESTAYPWEVIELCLAHTVGDQTQRAYFRSDLLAKRKSLMAEWSRFCDENQKAIESTVCQLQARSP